MAKVAEQYQCNVCSKHFSSKDALKQHSWLHTGEKRYKCATCSQSFTHSTSLKINQYKHRDEIFKCEICEQILANPLYLSQHLKAAHGIQPPKKMKTNAVESVKCNVCNKCFSSKYNLKQHSWVHTSDKRYKCATCSESFTHITSLKVHQYKHKDEIFKCEKCEHTSANPIYLSKHLQVVHGIQPTETKRKKIVKSLKTERKNKKIVKSLKTETKRKNILKFVKCNVCNKCFSSKYNLKQHSWLHTSEKRYKCATCSESFTHITSLKIHQYKHKDEIFKCEICDLTLANPINLNKHLKVVHGIQPTETETKTNLQSSLKTETKTKNIVKSVKTETKPIVNPVEPEEDYKCNVCNKYFMSKASLTMHHRLHTGEKRFKCITCPETFTSANDLIIHEYKHNINKELFKCQICEKIVHNLQTLENHISKQHSMTCKVICGELQQITNIDRSNPPKCSDCDQDLYYVTTLEQYRRKICKTLYKCEGCDNSNTYLEYSAKVSGQISKYGDNTSDSEGEKITDNESSTEANIEATKHYDENTIEPLQEQVKQEGFKTDNKFGLLSNIDNHNKVDALKAGSPVENHNSQVDSSINKIDKRSNIKDSVIPFETTSKREAEKQLSEFKITNRCKICQKTFASATTLKNHMLIHTGEKPHRCEICSQRFTFKASLRAHHISKHNSKYRCEFCGTIIYSKDSLQNHIDTKHDVSFESEKDAEEVCDGSKPSHCRNCDRALVFVTTLRHNNRNHTRKTLYKCEGCNKSFTFIEKIDTSTYALRKSDTSCEKTMIDRTPLSQVNTNESAVDVFPDDISTDASSNTGSNVGVVVIKPLDTSFKEDRNMCKNDSSSTIQNCKQLSPMHECFKCTMCFSTTAELFYHIRTHKDDTEFDCVMCKKVFQTSKILKNHVQTVHTESNKCMGEKDIELVRTSATELVEVYDVKHDHEEAIVNVRQCLVVVNRVDAPEKGNASAKDKRLVSTPNKHNVDVLEYIDDNHSHDVNFKKSAVNQMIGHKDETEKERRLIKTSPKKYVDVLDVKHDEDNIVNFRQCSVVVDKIDIRNAVQIRPDLHIHEVVDVKQYNDNSLVNVKQCSVVVNKVNVGEAVEIRTNTHENDKIRMHLESESNNPHIYDNDNDADNIEDNSADCSSDYNLINNKVNVGEAVEIRKHVQENDNQDCLESNNLKTDDNNVDDVNDNCNDECHGSDRNLKVNVGVAVEITKNVQENDIGVCEESGLNNKQSYDSESDENIDDNYDDHSDRESTQVAEVNSPKFEDSNNQNDTGLSRNSAENQNIHVSNLNEHDDVVTAHSESNVRNGIETISDLTVDNGFNALQNTNTETLQKVDMPVSTQVNISNAYVTRNDSTSILTNVDGKNTQHIHIEDDEGDAVATYTFQCELCSKSFPKEFSLKVHMRIHRRSNKYKKSLKTPYECDICKNNFPSLDKFKAHQRYHTGERPYKCFYCEQRFIDYLSMGKHIRGMHTDIDYRCEICEININGLKSFKMHLKDRHNLSTMNMLKFVRKGNTVLKSMNCQISDELAVEDILPKSISPMVPVTPSENDNNLVNNRCEVCSSKFNSSNGLRIHLNRKHKYSAEKICLKCGKLFENEAKLSLHTKAMHTQSDTKVRCKICKKLYSSKSSLRFHMTIHSGEKPFNCTICHKKFRCLSVLKYHRNTHENIRYDWKLCNKKYTNIFVYENHLRYVHKLPQKKKEKNNQLNRKVEVTCDMCQISFQSKVGLFNHMRIHKSMNKPIPCKECNKEFYNAASFKKHLLQHDRVRFHCKLCKANYKHSSRLMNHEFKCHRTEMEKRDMKDPDLTLVKVEKEDGSAIFRKERIDNTLDGETCNQETTKCEEDFNDLVKECVKLMNTDTTVYHCPRCGFKSFTPPSLMKHIQLHKDKGYNCVVCEENFENSTYLKSHVIKHKLVQDSNSKMTYAACTLCGRGFSHRRNKKMYSEIRLKLKMHMRTHKPVKLLKCNLCDKKFKFPAILKYHILSYHSDIEFNCEFCKAKYKTPLSLQWHTTKVHHVKCRITGSGKVVIKETNHKQSTSTPGNHSDQSTDTVTSDSVELAVNGLSVNNSRNIESQPIEAAVSHLDKATDYVQKHPNKCALVNLNDSVVDCSNGLHQSIDVQDGLSNISPRITEKGLDKSMRVVGHVLNESLGASETISNESVVDNSKNQPEDFCQKPTVGNKVVANISESENKNVNEIRENLVWPAKPTTQSPNVGSDHDIISKNEIENYEDVGTVCDENTSDSTSKEQAQTQYISTLQEDKLKKIALENVKYNRVKICLVNIGSIIVNPLLRYNVLDNSIKMKDNESSTIGMFSDSILQLNNEDVVGYNNVQAAISDTARESLLSVNSHPEKGKENTSKNQSGNISNKCEICTEIVEDLETHLKSHIRIRGKNYEYACKICLLVFENSLVLEIHTNLHKEISDNFNCVVCRKTLQSHNGARMHMRSHTMEDRYKCVICSKLFTGSTQLDLHIFTHIKFPKFKCEECNQVFQNDLQLKSHLRRKMLKSNSCSVCHKQFLSKELLEKHNCVGHATPRPHECNECGKKIAQLGGLREHIRVKHLKLKPHKCSICDETFSYRQQLDNHMDGHLHPEGFKCMICRKNYASKVGLESHLKSVHYGAKRKTKTRKSQPEDYIHKCDYANCNKVYPDKYGLKIHTQIHTGEKSHECKQCGEKFRYLATYNNHVNEHLGVKPYQCPDCGECFAGKSSFYAHIQIVHKGIKKHKVNKKVKCTICDRLMHKSSYENHMRIHNGKLDFTCEECGKCFPSNGTLRAHKLRHLPDNKRPFQCSVCTKGFITKFRLDEHTTIHTGEKNFKCDICNRAFAQTSVLKTHMRTHTGEKPWKCKVCGKSFSCHGSLYTHRIIHTGERPYSCTICDKKFKDRSARRMHIKSHDKAKK